MIWVFGNFGFWPEVLRFCLCPFFLFGKMSHQITAPTILLNFFVCRLAKKIISKVCVVFWAERVESEAVSQSWTALDLVGITTITYSLCSEKGLFFWLLDKNSNICIFRILVSQPLPIHCAHRKPFSFISGEEFQYLYVYSACGRKKSTKSNFL